MCHPLQKVQPTTWSTQPVQRSDPPVKWPLPVVIVILTSKGGIRWRLYTVISSFDTSLLSRFDSEERRFYQTEIHPEILKLEWAAAASRAEWAVHSFPSEWDDALETKAKPPSVTKSCLVFHDRDGIHMAALESEVGQSLVSGILTWGPGVLLNKVWFKEQHLSYCRSCSNLCISQDGSLERRRVDGQPEKGIKTMMKFIILSSPYIKQLHFWLKSLFALWLWQLCCPTVSFICPELPSDNPSTSI